MTMTQRISSNDVARWDDHADIVIIGYGIAGCCAALEARAAGADCLVVERASGGGGTSALSSGLFYLGGGTALQRACGVEDSPDNLYDFMMASCSASDPALIRAFCDGSVAHFDWLEAQGIPFERSYYKDKHLCPPTKEGLVSTGNENIWPYREIARPASRGHRVAKEGDNAGSLAMEKLLARCTEAGVRALYDARVTAAVGDAQGAVVGVVAQREGQPVYIGARRGVIIASGGFQMSREMLAEYAPQMLGNSEPIGVPYNDGDGIRLAQSLGAAVQAMGAIQATASFYPPSQLIKGIVVNALGERFVAEDSYHGRTGCFIMEQPGGIAWLILDANTFAYPELGPFFEHRFIDGWQTIGEMESRLGMPHGALEQTLAFYNRHAREGRDPLLHKHASWLTPLDHAPWAAFDISFNRSRHRFHTLGGLKTTLDAEVVTQDGRVITGLYAAGACASSIVQDGKGYGSGMTLAAGSFFGRVAGRKAAARSVH
jgi:3-oxo-5alpha-steroid 4-dehydrogenase